MDTDDYVPSVIQIGHNVIAFDLPKNLFIQELLKVGITRDFGQYKWLRNGLFATGKNPSNIIVEFSSPNVAKPFHMGHLRSTIIGNFVANIQEAVGHKVIRLNWLGDWGTQFGLLAHGLQNSDLEQILNCQDPMHELYNVYVKVNKNAENDENIATEARTLFAKLEAGSAQLKTQWSQIRCATVDSLEKVYSRLGIHFDHYHGEAMYGNQKTKDSVLNRLTESGLLTIIEDGCQVIDLDGAHKRRVVITKSDGSSLYITRDISAGLDRLKSFSPDKIIYVVENAQAHHFENLFEIISKLDPASSCKFQHVKFGRIQGMSTRKGTAVFLSDILNEAKERMLEKMQNASTTKVTENLPEVAEILGISAVFINDMKEKKTKNYEFSWDSALQNSGNSGIKLQYSHSRLCNLLEVNSHIEIPQDLSLIDFELLYEPEAIKLVLTLAQFDENLASSYNHLEPSILVKYLFLLCNDISKAVKVLKVKGTDEETALFRFLLFVVSKKVLHHGMSILGLKPLKKM